MSLASELLTRRTAFKPKAYPQTPYNRAREEWNDRSGALIRQAYNWRLAFFTQFLIVVILATGLLYQSSHSSIQPYLVEHNAQSGEALGLGLLPAWHYTPQEREYQYFLSAYRFTTQGAANELNEWAQKDERLSQIGQQTVSIEIVSINPIADSHSYQMRWTETVRTRAGELKEERHMTGIFPVKVEPPREEEDLRVNPLGIRIDAGFQWSKDA